MSLQINLPASMLNTNDVIITSSGDGANTKGLDGVSKNSGSIDNSMMNTQDNAPGKTAQNGDNKSSGSMMDKMMELFTMIFQMLMQMLGSQNNSDSTSENTQNQTPTQTQSTS